jgi:hypothetical protein
MVHAALVWLMVTEKAGTALYAGNPSTCFSLTRRVSGSRSKTGYSYSNSNE